MLFDRIAIVGVGLIGGSVGLAAKTRGAAGRVVGVGRDRGRLDEAVRVGAADEVTTELADGVARAGLVVVCTPVDRIADDVLAAATHARPGTLFTDGGSTKGNIAAAVAGRLPADVHFVPAHPLAGAEKGGVEHARADLFVNRLTILTPDDATPPAAVRRVERFWQALGSRVVRMRPDDHDEALATTSHLPHAVAAGVAGVTPPEWLPLSAGGFRDVTRIAGGSPDLWVPIFLANRAAVLAAADRFADRLAEFRRLVEAGDGAGLGRWLADAKQVRDALGT